MSLQSSSSQLIIPPITPKGQPSKPIVTSKVGSDTRSSLFETRLPRELQLFILTVLFAQVSAAIPSPGARFTGRAAAIRELVRLGRVSRSWLSLVTDGQLWFSFDASLFAHAFDSSNGIGIGSTSALRVLAGPAGLFTRELDLTGLVGLTDKDLAQIITASLRATEGEEQTAWVKVNLTGCRQLTQRTIDRLIRCSPNLKQLTLRGLPSVEASTMSLIARLAKIETVDVGYCPSLVFGPDSTLSGSWPTSLCELRLPATGVTDDLLKSLSALRQLQRLDLSHCSSLSDAGMDAFVENGPLPALRVVNLAGCSRLTDRGIGAWAGCVPALESLELSQIGSRLHDDGLIRLFGTTPRIRRLDLEDASNVTDRLLECFLGKYEGQPRRPPLARPANTLESLCLSYAAQLSERMMIRLIVGSEKLSVLKLDNTRATDLVVRTFLAKMRGVVGAEISVIDCRRVSDRGLIEFPDLVRLRRGKRGHWALALDYMDEDRGDSGPGPRSILNASDHRKLQVIDEMDETRVVLHSFHSWAKLDEIEKAKKMRTLKANSARTSTGEGVGQRRRSGRLSILRVIGVRQLIEAAEDIQGAQDVGAANGDAGQVELDPLLHLNPPNPIFSTSPKRSMSCLIM